MRRTLSSRIDQLEKSAPDPKQKSKRMSETQLRALMRVLRTPHEYSTWRHAGLSLEQLLALARDDSARNHANPWAAVGAREFEIQILERDAKIDAETAESLRKNLDAHFARDDSAAAQREPLADLPMPIKFDEAGALKAARLQCPLFDSLPLEGQVQYLEEDLLKRRQYVAQRRAAAARADATVEDRLDASMAELGLDFEQDELEIGKLKEKIAERDRRSGPSQKETSATT
jgi:hypothetical protein